MVFRTVARIRPPLTTGFALKGGFVKKVTVVLLLAAVACSSSAPSSAQSKPKAPPPVANPTPTPGHIHASLNSGAHMTIVYAGSEQAHLVALAQAEGARVTIAKSATAKKTVHHKLRYIAGGILVAVIIVVAVVLLVDRRRKLRETADGGGGGAPARSSPGDAG